MRLALSSMIAGCPVAGALAAPRSGAPSCVGVLHAQTTASAATVSRRVMVPSSQRLQCRLATSKADPGKARAEQTVNSSAGAATRTRNVSDSVPPRTHRATYVITQRGHLHLAPRAKLPLARSGDAR